MPMMTTTTAIPNLFQSTRSRRTCSLTAAPTNNDDDFDDAVDNNKDNHEMTGNDIHANDSDGKDTINDKNNDNSDNDENVPSIEADTAMTNIFISCKVPVMILVIIMTTTAMKLAETAITVWYIIH